MAAPIKQMPRYLSIGAAGEVKRLLRSVSDLPRRAETEVAWHLFDQRAVPSSKEGRSKPYSCSLETRSILRPISIQSSLPKTTHSIYDSPI